MKRLSLITIAVLVVILLAVIGFKKTRRQPGPTVNPGSPVAALTNADIAPPPTAEEAESDVAESSPPAETARIVENMTERLRLNPWARELPKITDHFSIFFSGKNDHPTVEIILESKNAAEFSAYQAEALAWLKSQGAPVDSLTTTIRYRGQN